jgi:hypothetical protein
VTFALRVLLALAVAGVLASSAAGVPAASSAGPSSGLRSVAFVAIFGHGTVTSVPRGIHCPGACRAIFPAHSHLTLRATAAPGWTLARFAGSCATPRRTCGFDLVSSHDCIGGACPTGAFGVRIFFVRHKAST